MLPAVPRLAWAQTYPSRPVTMVVTFPPGSGSDIMGRILKVAKQLAPSVRLVSLAASFDHLVGTGEQRGRHVDAQRLGGC